MVDGVAFLGSPPRVWGQHERASTRTPGHSVHPHACGDNLVLKCQSPQAVGSPPRVWGQREVWVDAWWSSSGSPPRVWGQPLAQRGRYRAGRFTPTRVGTTGTAWGGFPGFTVHPHACGDNWNAMGLPNADGGSPPRVWGQRRWGRYPRPLVRFTPTRVGTTLGARERAAKPAVHPHACGDNRLLT